jgi:hypothetical protein
MTAASVSSFPWSIAHVGGHCFVRRGQLIIVGGADPSQAYVVNLDFKAPPSMVAVRKIGFAGSQTVHIRELDLSLTCGGIGNSTLYAHKWGVCPVSYNVMKECTSMGLLQRGSKFDPMENQELPPVRQFHAAAWDPINSWLWIFGGTGSGGLFGDVWVWSLETGQWTELEIPGTPAPIAGATMTFVGDRIYLFADGFWELDVRSRSAWREISVPPELEERRFGCVLVGYSTREFNYVIFTGGASLDWSDVIVETEVEGSLADGLRYGGMWMYAIETEKFRVLIPQGEFPEVTRHSATCADDLLFIAGGINIGEDGSGFYHRGLVRIDLGKLLECAVPAAPVRVVSRCVQDPLLESALIADFREAALADIAQKRASVKVQKGARLFELHQREHVLGEFVCISQSWIDKRLFETRIGLGAVPPLALDHRLIADLVEYAYTDCINSEIDRAFPFPEFLALMESCRRLELYRFVWLEICFTFPFLTAKQFFEFACSLHEKLPMFMDCNLSIVRNMFERALPRYHSLANFRSLQGIDPSILRFVLEHIQPKESEAGQVSLSVPSSAFDGLLDLAVSTFQTRDGPVVIDNSFLGLDPAMMETVNLCVVAAVQNCRIESLLVFQSVELCVSVLALLDSATVDLSDSLFNRLIRRAKPLFMAFARERRDLREALRDSLPSIRFPALLEFILRLVGVEGRALLVDGRDFSLQYDSRLGYPVPDGNLPCPIGRFPVLALATLMYTRCSVEDLPPFFDPRELADRFCTLCETSPCLPPGRLRDLVLAFIESTWTEFRTDRDFMARNFPRMHRIGVDYAILNGIDYVQLLRDAQKHLTLYTQPDLEWLLDKVGSPTIERPLLEYPVDCPHQIIAK